MAEQGIKPVWEHDCEFCELVAQVVLPSVTDGRVKLLVYDVYRHIDGGIVARFGDDGPEYLSGDNPWIDTADRRVRLRVFGDRA